MVYREYEAYKRQYRQTQNIYNAILDEQERLFLKTQPKGIRFDRDRVSGGGIVNAFERYVEAKEETAIDQRLTECRAILDERKRLLDEKGTELRASKIIHDRVYVMRILDRKRINHICRITNRSRATIFRILDEIKKGCETI